MTSRNRMNDEDLEDLDDLENDDIDNSSNKKKGKNSILRELLNTSIYLLVVFALSLLIVEFVGQRTTVVGQSMESTLSDGDNLIVDKISYRFHEPERFDIVVFPFQWEKNTFYIKRIIGLPGETINIDMGVIYIDGEPLEEHYGREIILDPGEAISPITIGENQYFVMGDNRNHSSDSRTSVVGLVDRDKIIGRAWLRIMPFDKFGLLKDHD